MLEMGFLTGADIEASPFNNAILGIVLCDGGSGCRLLDADVVCFEAAGDRICHHNLGKGE